MVTPGTLEAYVEDGTCSERRNACRTTIEKEIQHLAALVQQRFDMQERALGLQADENARRLEELNNAHGRAETERSRVLSREMFDAFKVEYDQFRLDTAKQLSVISTRSITWTAAVGMAIAVLSLVLKFVA